MGLQAYYNKRKFSDTPEPKGTVKKAAAKKLKFVIQKHHASHLHYDFRLELDGVLKSWAVPKGPSLNPNDKRLAMMVEDHPYEYKDFEGIIPKGNYGAGTVMIWDEGTCEAIETDNREEEEKVLKQGLHKGNLKFRLKGKKLNGEFALVKLKNKQDNSWLLIKKADEFATDEDVTNLNRSVISDRSLEEIKAEAEKEGKVWRSNRNSDDTPKKEAEQPLPKLATIKGVHKGKMPHNIKPMLATLVDEPFSKPDWLFELKWDGYRAIAEVNNDDVELYSRNLLSFKSKFPEVIDALSTLNINAVFDGEVVVLNEEGKSDFSLIQKYQSTGIGDIRYYVFDILFLDGYDLSHLPLLRRKEILQNTLKNNEIIKYSDHVLEDGITLYNFAEEHGLEGIIAKNAKGEYKAGARSKDWLKIKTHMRQEAVIAGFTEGRGGRKHFGALVLGVYEGDELKYIGHTGGGFNDKKLQEMIGKLKPLIRKASPFKEIPKTNSSVTWVKPTLVCEVSFHEWTSEGIMRQPIFVGLREDKPAKDVKREKQLKTEQAVEAPDSTRSLKVIHKRSKAEEVPESKTETTKPATKKKAVTKKSVAKTTSKSKPSKIAGISIENGIDQKVMVEGHELSFTNLNKVYWKKEGYAKLDLINYYDQIADYILPYLKDRPESLRRNPNGIAGKSFFQKDVKDMPPDWIKTEMIFSESNDKDIKYLICQNRATLLYLANLGCIELNPWHSRVGSLDYPDYLIIDLDPHEISFEKVIEAALIVKDVLDELKIPSYCKTSGSSGLHIYVPLGAKYDYDQAKNFAHVLVSLMHQRSASFTSLERSPAKRRRKVYLDFLQNRFGQTIAAPYCVRPKPGATVATPLHWEEVKKGLSPSQFTIRNILDRLKDTGDILKPIMGKGIDMEKILKKIESL